MTCTDHAKSRGTIAFPPRMNVKTMATPTPRLVGHGVDLNTLQAKRLPLPLKFGEVLRHIHWSERNTSTHPRDVKVFT